MRKLPCTQARGFFFILAAAFSLLVLGVEATAAEKKPEYDQAILDEIGVKLDQLYESGVIPNYVVDIRRAGEVIYFRARGKTELGGASRFPKIRSMCSPRCPSRLFLPAC